jgi:flagellar hook-associated protein 2
MANDLRIPGINTGMDTQATIDKIMKYTKAPLDRLKQKQQTLIWKQEAYRTQNTALSQLKDLLLNLKLQGTYTTKSVTSSNNQVVTATGNSSAVNGSYSVKVQQLATAAMNTSSSPVSIRSKVTGNRLDSVTIDASNNSFYISLDGVQQQITLQTEDFATYTGDGSSGHTLDELAAKIQEQLDNAFTTTKVYVRATSDNNIQFYTAQDSSGAPHHIVLNQVTDDNTLANLQFETDGSANSKELIGSILATPIIINSSNQKFRITVGNGTTQEITLTAKQYDTVADLAQEINSKLADLAVTHPELANVKASATAYNQLRISSTNNSSIKLDSGSTTDALATKMGFASGTTSEAKNTFSTTISFWNQKDRFINGDVFKNPALSGSSQFRFSINGKEFKFTYNNTLNDVISALRDAGINAYYDDSTDKLTFAATKTGDNNPSGKEMLISDPDGFLGNLFNLSEANEQGGEDAIVFINNIEMRRQSNTVTYNNVTFTLNGVTGTQPNTMVNVTTDTSGIVAKIKEFVDKYNEVIGGINTELTESRATAGDKYTFYTPLTDAQKEEMTEDQIKAWEEKAKQGILHNDSILSGAVSEMRASLYRQVDTPRTLTGFGLSGTGIDLTGVNRFSITVGRETKEISLTERSYTATEYKDLVKDIQNKLDAAFGYNRVKVGLNGSNAITLTSQNQAMTLNSASQNSGLGQLGFNDGANVKATYSNITQIGITTGSYYEKGKLSLDTEALEEALQNDPDGVIRLLTNNETVSLPDNPTSSDIANAKTLEKNRQGLFYSLYDVLDNQIKKVSNQAGSTGTASAGNELGKQLIELGDQIDTTQDRISAEENRLWNMFTQMEVMIGQMNSQSSWIASMLGQNTNS